MQKTTDDFLAGYPASGGAVHDGASAALPSTFTAARPIQGMAWPNADWNRSSDNNGYVRNERVQVPIQVAVERDTQHGREQSSSKAAAQSDTVDDKPSDDLPFKQATAGTSPTSDSWPGPVPGTLSMPVADSKVVEQVESLYEKYVHDEDRRKAIAGVLEHLRKKGMYRLLSPAPRNWRARISLIEKQHPNFAEVCSYLRVACAIAEVEEREVQLAPMLFDGPPGIGKSFFASQIAKLLDTSFKALRMETSQSNSDLAGSSEFWSNSQPGHLFKELVFGERANPVFFLDELEKTSADRYDPLAPLYALFERDSAAAYTDLAHPWLELNTSAVVWAAATNDHTRLPAPILSRMKVFNIPPPTPAQSLSIARHLWEGLCAELPMATSKVLLSEDALAAVSAYSPRQVRTALREAIGRALCDGRDAISAKDIDDSLDTGTTKAHGMGFL
jgi:ATP-dependent Lon protease